MKARSLGVLTGQAWHEARAGRIGGSDIGAVCGLSPHITRDELLEQKAGLTEPRPETKAMRRGTLLEPAVIAYLVERFGLDAPDAEHPTYQHETNDRLIYNPDAICGQVLLEAKSTSDRSVEHGWGRAGTDQVPDHYAAQVQYGMHLLGLRRCHLGVIAGATSGRPNLDFAAYTITYDPAIAGYLIHEAEAFLADLDALTESRTAA